MRIYAFLKIPTNVHSEKVIIGSNLAIKNGP